MYAYFCYLYEASNKIVLYIISYVRMVFCSSYKLSYTAIRKWKNNTQHKWHECGKWRWSENESKQLRNLTHAKGFAFLSTGRPGSASLLRSPTLEDKCRSFTFFFSEEGMVHVEYHTTKTSQTKGNLSILLRQQSAAILKVKMNDVIDLIKTLQWLDSQTANQFACDIKLGQGWWEMGIFFMVTHI